MTQETKQSSLGMYTLKYVPFIKSFTSKQYRRFGERGELQELISAAIAESVSAERTFNPEIASFPTFVKPRLLGAIVSAITAPSHTSQGLLGKIHRFITEYVEKHGAAPARHLIVQGLDITHQKFDAALASKELQDAGEYFDEYFIEPGEDIVEIDEMLEHIERLPKRLQSTAKAYFNEEKIAPSKEKELLMALRESMGVTL